MPALSGHGQILRRSAHRERVELRRAKLSAPLALPQVNEGRGSGGLRIAIEGIHLLADRTFRLEIGDGALQFEGTNSVALKLRPGPYAVELVATTTGGDERRVQISTMVEDGRVTEAVAQF